MTKQMSPIQASQILQSLAQNDNVMSYLLGRVTGDPEEAFRVAIAALRGPQADPETGLAPCGCGTPAICVTQTSITYDGKKKVKYSVKCPKNHVHTDWFDTVVQAVNYWHRAMGCPTK